MICAFTVSVIKKAEGEFCFKNGVIALSYILAESSLPALNLATFLAFILIT